MAHPVTPRTAGTAAAPDSGHRRQATTARVALLLALGVLIVRLAIGVADVLFAAEGSPSARALAGLGLGIVVLLAALVALRAVERDVADRDRATLDLQASEAKFSGILAIAADAIITVNEEQRIVHYNRGAEEIFGWSEAEMRGQPLEVLLPERYRAAHARHIARFRDAPEIARRMGERSEIFGRRKDGSDFPAEASISRLAVGDRRLYTVVLRDITARRRQQMDERFLSRAAVTLGASLDYDSTLRSVVHVAVPHLADCAVLDIEEGSGAWRRVVSVHDDPGLTRALRTWETPRLDWPDWPFPTATATASESTVLRHPLAPGWERDGAPGDAAAERLQALGITGFMTIPLPTRGRVLGTLTLLVTDRSRDYGPDQRGVGESLARLAAPAIENASLYRMAQRATVARDEILGVVSHDLRNPLSAVTMCARVLLNDAAADPARSDLAATILESTTLMNRLIEDLLDVAMIDSGRLAIQARPEPLAPLVQQVTEMLEPTARDRGVRLTTECPPDFALLFVDGARFVQLLANLVGNAVKFTERGGRITITAELRDRHALVAVRDTGVGIPPEHLPRVFDRYWHARRQSRIAGTGLGLAIARGIVEAHGGRIWVESQVGAGSTFRFTVPVADAAAAASPPALVSDRPRPDFQPS